VSDQGTGIVVIGDISGVLREYIAHDLIDGVISLFLERTVNDPEDFLAVQLLVRNDFKSASIVRHKSVPPFHLGFFNLGMIILDFFRKVKRKMPGEGRPAY
jgi:hypothetical protein